VLHWPIVARPDCDGGGGQPLDSRRELVDGDAEPVAGGGLRGRVRSGLGGCSARARARRPGSVQTGAVSARGSAAAGLSAARDQPPRDCWRTAQWYAAPRGSAHRGPAGKPAPGRW
jgi:hypothetical protein